ncbi:MULTISPECIES: TrgA family protein [Halocynthiibacter]|uniref:TrgA family protein n=1 Tax=Halocynthiibacter halioticoli TaxID=2986804 RepID=A0AAE3J0Q6_9RHOB|nr:MULTISPECIES: TrgA family protein [Halocynthiibacter]MCV6824570.1 TrgA family protein [Halocynthiibacter halioticoli]MCW4057571.1 TrgA family protein [Halocynthiibacter sp. SDUM655004]MDE0589396.1 TrgA family protein [Halocynthiibacter sp. C4]
MLSMSRVMAFVTFAAVAWFASELVKFELPEGMNAGKLSEVNAILAGIVAWRVAGVRQRIGYSAALGNGFTAMVAAVLTCLFFQSGYEMIMTSMRGRYDGPMDALVEMAKIYGEMALYLATPAVFITLLVGGCAAGYMVEWASRRWN